MVRRSPMIAAPSLSWNLFHGRDFPPDPALLTLRSRLLRMTERNRTHVQVNRDLLSEFARVLAAAEWDVALLQECPPRWAAPLAAACDAEAHRVLTSRNAFQPLSSALFARLNPDLIASWEGGSNLTLVRRGPVGARRSPSGASWSCAGTPARAPHDGVHPARGRSSASPTCTPAPTAGLAAAEVLAAADRAVEWAAGAPLVLGGDFNLRPRQSDVFGELARRHGLSEPAEPDAIDHLLARGLDVVQAPQSWPAERREARRRRPGAAALRPRARGGRLPHGRRAP